MQDIIFFEETGQSKKIGWKSSVNGKELKILAGNRKNAEHKKNCLLIGFEYNEKKDSLHYPRSGMDQVIAKFMKKNNHSYCIPLNSLLEEKDKSQTLRRIAFNLKLANKYGFDVVLASFAKKEENQRSPQLIRALAESLGLREDIAKKSLKKTFK